MTTTSGSPPVMLVAWRGRHQWTQWHIVAGLKTRCGLRIPPRSSLHPQTRTELTVTHWFGICAPCREAMLRTSPPSFLRQPTRPAA